LVATGDVWLTDQTSSVIEGWVIQMLIRVAAIALITPIFVSAAREERHHRGKPEST
jgi:hypothetical protein